jgi:SAM-dependent methyltransferase
MELEYLLLANELVANDTLELQSAGEDQESMLRLLPLNGVRKVLDVGCGSGALTRRLAQRLGSSTEIWGLDLALNHVEYARMLSRQQGISSLRYMCGDILDPPRTLPRDFDLVCEKYVLMSMVGEGASRFFLDRVKECLRPGGILALIEPDINFGQDRYPPPPEPLRSVLPRIVTYYQESGAIDWRCGIRLYDYLNDAGFANIEIFLADPRIMKGGAPVELVQHACTDVEDLIRPCLEERGCAHLVAEVSEQWRDYLRGKNHFIYNPVFVAYGMVP